VTRWWYGSVAMVCFPTERDAVTAVILLRRRMHVLASALSSGVPNHVFVLVLSLS
jgi:hypothetical protein